MHFVHEPGKPLIDALPHRAGAGVSASYNPNYRVGGDGEEDRPHVRPYFRRTFLRVRSGKTSFLRCVLNQQRHRNRDERGNRSGYPEEPAPMERRHAPESEEEEAGEQRRAEIKNPVAPKVDHETEDASEAPTLAGAEPGRIDFHHPG